MTEKKMPIILIVLREVLVLTYYVLPIRVV